MCHLSSIICHLSSVIYLLTEKCPPRLPVSVFVFVPAAAEAERLVKGVNILVVTPGRLLDHLQVGRASLSAYISYRVP